MSTLYPEALRGTFPASQVLEQAPQHRASLSLANTPSRNMVSLERQQKRGWCLPSGTDLHCFDD